MTILENNCMQSTASSAGYSTGGTLVSAFAAYIMLNGHPLPLPLMLAWVFFLAVLGVTMAIPMKRQMINIEQLRFPSGIAAAETLRALHSHGARPAAPPGPGNCRRPGRGQPVLDRGPELIGKQLGPLFARALWSAAAERIILRQSVDRPHGDVRLGPDLPRRRALTGLRVSASMMLGGTLCWAVFVPILQHQGIITGTGFANWCSGRSGAAWPAWSLPACFLLPCNGGAWCGRSATWAGCSRRGEGRTDSDVDAIEAPMSWFIAGQFVSLVALAWLAKATFGMPYWQSTVAVLLSFFLALVACRVTGETDTTPVGAMGKVTQLIFGGHQSRAT